MHNALGARGRIITVLAVPQFPHSFVFPHSMPVTVLPLPGDGNTVSIAIEK